MYPKGFEMYCYFSLQDYHDHIAEISAKLVAIMDSLFDKLLSKVMIYINYLALLKGIVTFS